MSQNVTPSRIRTIALEEAFMHPKLFELYPSSLQRDYSFLKSRLIDVGLERIRRMDAAGIDLEVLSHVQPGVQLIDEPNQAIDLAKEINDCLAEAIKKYPTRLAGFATLPTQSPKDAADELERAVLQLGFKGALINGHTKGRYLDHESFSVLLERAQALDVPIYIHPTDPPQTVTDAYYSGYPNLVTGWGWPVETGTHVLRMMAGGVFDRYPRLKIIVGHMGEMIPYCLTRLNVALTMGSWLLDDHGMEKNVSYYMKENVYVTTSGVFDQPVFNLAHSVLGIDHIMFSVDEPMRDSFEAMDFLNHTQISRQDREKLAHGNAEHLLKITPTSGPLAQIAQTGGERLRSVIYSFRARTQSKIGRTLVSLMVK